MDLNETMPMTRLGKNGPHVSAITRDLGFEGRRRASLFRHRRTCRKSGPSRCTRDVLRRPSQRAARCQESMTKVTAPGLGQEPLFDVPSPVTSLPEWGSRRPPAVKTWHVVARFHTCVAGRAVQVIDTENSWYWTVQSAGTLAA